MTDYIKLFDELKQALAEAKQERSLSSRFVVTTMPRDLHEPLERVHQSASAMRTTITEMIATLEDFAAEHKAAFCLDCSKIIALVAAHDLDCADDEVEETLERNKFCYGCWRARLDEIERGMR